MELPIVNTNGFQTLRRRYGLDHGSRGLNLIRTDTHPAVLIVFVSDTERYRDYLESDTICKYEFQDQEIRADGKRKRFPKPFHEYGPMGTNLTVLNALRDSNFRLPTVLIGKFAHNQWAELFSDCVLTDWSQDSDGKPFFNIERTRVARWLLGPIDDEEEE